MGSIILGLIFLVGLVVVGGIILNVIFGVADTGKRMTAGVAIQNGPVRSVWRGLPLPIEVRQLREKSEREAVYILPGARVAVAAQWLENTWGRAGYVLAPTAKDGALRSTCSSVGKRRGLSSLSSCWCHRNSLARRR